MTFSPDTTIGSWGKVYGLPYDLPDGRRVWMCRGKYNRVRFYTAEGEQVGPEQSNVAPAVAFALTYGWRQGTEHSRGEDNG